MKRLNDVTQRELEDMTVNTVIPYRDYLYLCVK